MELTDKLNHISEYNNLRNVKQYLLGLQKNLGKDARLGDIISSIEYKMIVIEKQISNDNTEQ